MLTLFFFLTFILASGAAALLFTTVGSPIPLSWYNRPKPRDKDYASRGRKTGHEFVRLFAITASVVLAWCAMYLTLHPSAPWNQPLENVGGTIISIIMALIIGYYIFQVPNDLEHKLTSFMETYSFDLNNVDEARDKIISLLGAANKGQGNSKVFIFSATPVPLIESAEYGEKDKLFTLLLERVQNNWPTAFLVYNWVEPNIGLRRTTAGQFFFALAGRKSSKNDEQEKFYRETVAKWLYILHRFLDKRTLHKGPDNIADLNDVCLRLLDRRQFEFNQYSASMSVIVKPNSGELQSYVRISGTTEELADPKVLPIEGGAQQDAARLMLNDFNEKWRKGNELNSQIRTDRQTARDLALIESFHKHEFPKVHNFDPYLLNISETVDVFPVSISLETENFLGLTRCLLTAFETNNQYKANLVDIGCGTGVIGIAGRTLAARVYFNDFLEEAIELTKQNCTNNNVDLNNVHFLQCDATQDCFDTMLNDIDCPVLLVFNQPLYESPLNPFNLGSNYNPFDTLKTVATKIFKSKLKKKCPNDCFNLWRAGGGHAKADPDR